MRVEEITLRELRMKLVAPFETSMERTEVRRILLIDRIEWRDGWPFVGTPSENSRRAPAA